MHKKREEFAQNILLLFYPFRDLSSFNITEGGDWWDALINIRDLGEFSTKSIFHIGNIQSWNDTFLSKTDVAFLGEVSESDSSDTDDDGNFNLASGMVEG